MEQKIETKLTFKDKLNNLYNVHKVKIIILLLTIIIVLITSTYIQQKNKKNNNLIGEKYIQAGLNLSLNKKDEAQKLFDEIILSKNKFYSILALNSIIEKKLIDDDVQILKYFDALENIDFNDEVSDLLIFKKALYLLKTPKNEEGERLLENLIKKDSRFKFLAEEVITN